MAHARLRIIFAVAATLGPADAALAYTESAAEIALETYEGAVVGQPPEGWKARRGDMAAVYTVQEEQGRKFLHADAKDVSVLIGKEKTYDVKQHPVLTWRWRAHALPPGGDERGKETNDSAAGVYVVFGGRPVPKTIKYVWSSTLPVDTRTDSPFASRTKIVVVESGAAKLGQWVEERVNVLEDYRKFFGEDPPEAQGIAILSDADNTHARAIADYAAIVARTE